MWEFLIFFSEDLQIFCRKSYSAVVIKGLISKMYKELKQLNNIKKKPTNLKMGRGCEQTFF